MADLTPNINLQKPLDNETADIAIINANMDEIDKKFGTGANGHSHDGTVGQGPKISYNDLSDKPTPDDIGAVSISDYVRHPGYGATTGAANTYAVTLDPAPSAYVDGMAVTVKINADNTGASTINVNGLGPKSVKKANGNDVSTGNLKAGSIYSLRYNGTNFILQGEGGEYGTAVAADVLTGKTIGTDAGLVNGTMPNNGPASAETVNLTSEGQEYTIAAGYHSGLRKIKAVITNLAAAVIKAGVTVGGIVGTFTADATAVAAQILSGYTAYVNGVKLTGTMANRAGDNPNLASSISSTTLKLRAPGGYYDGVDDNVTITDVDFIAANIKSGVNIFGLAGSYDKIYGPGDTVPLANADIAMLPIWRRIDLTGTIIFITLEADGYLYVGTNDYKISKIRLSDNAIIWTVSPGAGSNLIDIAYGTDGYLYALFANKMVHKLQNSDGASVGNASLSAYVSTPYQIEQNGSYWYISSYNNGGYPLQIWRCSDMTVLSMGPNLGSVYLYGMDIDTSGNVYVVYNTTVGKYNSTLGPIQNYTHTTNLFTIHCGTDGYIYAGDTAGKVIKLNASLGLQWTFTGSASQVRCIKYAADGYLYIAHDDGYIEKVNPSNGALVWGYQQTGKWATSNGTDVFNDYGGTLLRLTQGVKLI